MKTATLNVNGMTCGGCVASVKHALAEVPGVAGVEVSLPERQVIVRYDEARVSLDAVGSALQSAGYDVISGAAPRPSARGCCCS